ncbi:Ku protein [Pseudomonas sp. ZM23]|uniref:Non-homologous end joining protein Ku n=1 Tax=Pseudomonas triclosanedens TaxID=2961893 RepID=A0ABY7A772_9PSED|nr:Ku protein [Pseudomonas triclosanedens]MCP8466251.1 Ku protein [Pseudomonas triclosanedens]MCP8471777.1 Ku protein [Pseudomonas triclosanedens]MCP8478870.1 Ku protein [Pseudomonas triclosanedens]WAI52331.1 Ku protein [Pseudomonas triclosanedens]
MARVIWKGAISFGLVHIPVSLNSASRSTGTDFDWLDEHSLEPVGYKRVNKITGKEVPKEHIVKGVELEKGRYVVISEEEIRTARPEATQTIDILSFIERSEIPVPFYDSPYYLTPERRGEKVYVLLRETLRKSGKAAVCQLVMHSRQHLAMLREEGEAILLMTLRWPAQVREVDELALSLDKVKLDKREMEMAERLVKDMSGKWTPADYEDSFSEEIHRLVEQKAAEGKLANVPQAEEQGTGEGADIIDLTELLKRSLKGDRRKTRTPAARSGSAKRKTS